jgi:hypothetical protein
MLPDYMNREAPFSGCFSERAAVYRLAARIYALAFASLRAFL